MAVLWAVVIVKESGGVKKAKLEVRKGLKKKGGRTPGKEAWKEEGKGSVGDARSREELPTP